MADGDYAAAVKAAKDAGGTHAQRAVATAPVAVNVATPSADHDRLSKLWALPRTLMQGTRGMRSAGLKYLPKEAAETGGAYDSRLSRTTLFNAFRKTVKDMTGKVFQREVTLEDDVPETLVTYAENIDLAGRHLNVFARDVFFDGMQTGINYILVEMPPALQQGATLAEEQAAGQRPYLVHIKAEDLIGFKCDVVDGVVTLTQARIKESVTVPDGDFGEKVIQQIRVLIPGAWQTWRHAVQDGKETENWEVFDEGANSLDEIPLVPVYINRTGFMLGEPPLEDLADLNVAHWQSQSDQRNILHLARVPILFGAGFGDQDAQVAVGASTMFRTSNAAATLQYVEHSGAAIGSGNDDLTKLEMQMQVQGLQLLQDGPGSQTATGEIRDEAKENSPLAMMAMALGDALECAFGYMAQYIGVVAETNEDGADKGGGSVDVNTDFGVGTGTGIDMTVLLQAATANVISKETFWSEMKRRDILADSFDADVEKTRLESEAPVLPDPGPGNGMDLGGKPPPKSGKPGEVVTPAEPDLTIGFPPPTGGRS